jgi:hypothetical protein
MLEHFAIAGTEAQVAERIRAILPLIDELIVHPISSSGFDTDEVAELVAEIWSSQVTEQGRSQ